MSFSSSELETILAERLDLVRKEKSILRESIEVLETKLKNARASMVQTPREKDEELVAMLQKLEHTHNTTPQTNAEEREFMREKEKLRQKRKTLAAFNKVQAEVNDFRAKLTDLRKAQAEKDDAINELHQGLRKVKVANKTGCANSDIAERKFTVESSKVARIVGRGGSNLRFIETGHGVSIEIDSSGGVVRVMGTEGAINSAVAAIMTIVETSIEEFTLSDEIIVCLMMDKAQRVNDIQAQFAVRLDISRAKNLCKVTGLTDSVVAAKALILSLQSIRTDILLEASALSAVIGKGGASIQALQEEFGVAINVNRERNTVEVVGMRPDVTGAVVKIKEIVETNKEVEEIIQMEKHVLLGCLMAAGAQVLRGISRDFNVRVDAENTKDATLQTIKIKGTHGKVMQAKAHVVQLVGEFLSNSLVFEVPDDVIPAILGKGGSGIKAFREKYPGANIDIEGQNIHIQSASAEVRAAIKAEIDVIIDANYSQLVEFSEETKSQLRSTQGLETRNAVTKDLNVRLVVDGSTTAVKVRGSRAEVLQAVTLLEHFKETHSNHRMVLTDETYPVLLANKAGEESMARQLETRYAVEIRSNRKDLSLTINGSPENVALTKAAIEGILSGDAKHGAQLVDIHRLVLSALIGKGGANISKMEADLGVKFDVAKSTNQLRILGTSEEKVLHAKLAVHTFIHSSRITESITVPSALAKKDLDATLKRAADIFQTEIAPAASSNHKDDDAAEPSKNNSNSNRSKVYSIKGIYQLVLDTKEYLTQQFAGQCTYTLPVLPHHMEALQKQTHGSLKRLQDKFSVTLQLQTAGSTHEVKLQGTPDSVPPAKKELLKLLEKYFPTEIALIESSASCLRDCFNEAYVVEVRKLGALATIDRIQNLVLLTGAPASLEAAKELAARRVTQWEECHASIAIDPSVVPALVGKAGASINALRKETKVTIEISATNTSVDIQGATKELVQEARVVIEKRIHQLLSERWEITAPVDFFPILIGKQGASIIKLRAETGANIDVDGVTIKVHGAEDKVAAAKAAILALMTTTEAKVAGSKVLVVPAASVAMIIGAKGATVRDIQEKTGVRFDFDRVSHKCSLKGSVEGVESAIKLVDEILSREGFPAAYVDGQTPPPSASPAAVPVSEEQAEDAVPATRSAFKPLLGAPPSLLQKSSDKNLSKSALKRLRRKQAQNDDGNEEGEENDSDGEEEEPLRTAAAAVLSTHEEQASDLEEEEDEQSAPAVAAVAPAASVAVVPAAVPMPVPVVAPTPVPVVVAAPTLPTRVGVIGKAAAKPAAVAPLAVQPVQTQAAPAFALNSADQHHYHQQHLINLLLGDSAAPNPSLYAAAPAPALAPAHNNSYVRHDAYSVPAQEYTYHSHAAGGQAGYSYSAQPSALYAAAPSPPAPIGSTRTGLTAPPGIGMSFSSGSHSPPPPGLSPIGAGITTSRFSFGDFNTTNNSSAPLNVPVLPQYQYQYQPPIQQTTHASTSIYGAAGAPAAAQSAPQAAAPAGNYYKSKSGFSVRL